MIKNKLFSKKEIFLFVSYENLTWIVVSKSGKDFKIIEKDEYNGQIFWDSSIKKENLKEFLISKHKNYQGEKINIILNLPYFFIQKINAPNPYKLKDKEIIENIIKQEIPINLEKYYWQWFVLPTSYDNLMIIFQEKEVINNLIEEVLLFNFIPSSINYLFSKLINFIKQKYALSYDKSYLIISYEKDLLTIINYDLGFINNIYNENIKPENIEETLKRIVNFAIKKINNPLDFIFIFSQYNISEILNNNFNDLKIIDISKDLNSNTFEIIALSSKDKASKEKSEISINLYNLEKEMILYSLNKNLNIWVAVSLILLVLSSIFLSGFYFYIKNNIDNQINQIASIKGKNINIYLTKDKIEFITGYLKNMNKQKENFKNINYINNLMISLKNFDLINLDYSDKFINLFFKKPKNKKDEEILNILKNNLKLNNISIEGDTVKINLPLKNE
jgi:hypothetical protein